MNVFTDFILKAMELREAKAEMKWWDKINPFTRKKLKKAVQILQQYKDELTVDCILSKEYLYDFQRAVLTYKDEHSYDSIYIAYDERARNILIFFHTIFYLNEDQSDTCIVDIIGDTIKIKAVIGSLSCSRYIPEELGQLHRDLADLIRQGVRMYLESWLE